MTRKRKTWQQSFELLLRFTRREGQARVPARHFERGYHLGRWVQAQRRNWHKLTVEQRRMLQFVVDWTRDERQTRWNDGYKHLQAYVRRNGHAQPPRKYISDDGYRLGLWLFHQRDEYFLKRLDPKRRKLLEVLPGWVWIPTRDHGRCAERSAAGSRRREGSTSPDRA